MPGPLTPPWQTDFLQTLPLFAPIRAAAQPFASSTHWPSLDQLNTALANRPRRILTASGHAIRFVPQATRSRIWTEKYEPRIFLRGEIQTREENWHDFFNALAWLTFPQTKAVLNELQYEQFHAAEQAGQRNRTRVQDALTLFDEGGAIIVCSDPGLLDLLRRYAWKDLFWDRRVDTEQHLRVFLFGHALYEKALAPYRGMTAKCVVLDVAPDFFTLPLSAQLASVDGQSAGWFCKAGSHLRTAMLAPLPILGVPGWISENGDPSFYDDKRYFRDHYSRSATA